MMKYMLSDKYFFFVGLILMLSPGAWAQKGAPHEPGGFAQVECEENADARVVIISVDAWSRSFKAEDSEENYDQLLKLCHIARDNSKRCKGNACALRIYQIAVKKMADYEDAPSQPAPVSAPVRSDQYQPHEEFKQTTQPAHPQDPYEYIK